jgi:hypothetical protein
MSIKFDGQIRMPRIWETRNLSPEHKRLRLKSALVCRTSVDYGSCSAACEIRGTPKTIGLIA